MCTSVVLQSVLDKIIVNECYFLRMVGSLSICEWYTLKRTTVFMVNQHTWSWSSRSSQSSVETDLTCMILTDNHEVIIVIRASKEK